MLHGDTTNIPLQNIFQTLDLNQQEGILVVKFEKLERHVAIRRSGVSFLTDAPHSSQILQQVLGRLRILTSAEYFNVFSTSTVSTPPGEVLLDRHLISPDHVVGPIREQFLELLYEIFAWRGAQYSFDVRSIGEERLIFGETELGRNLEFPVSSILMEVARREDEWQRIRELIPSAHQIYRLSGDPEQLGALAPHLDPERAHELLGLLNGERTLEDVLEETSIPPFFVFCIVRELIVAGMIYTIPLEEKKALVDRLRLQYPMEKILGIYRSILDEDPDDLSVRRKLLGHFERSNVGPEVLIPHYRVLADVARKKGDISSTREYLRKVLDVEPRDLDSLEHMTLLEQESKRDKERIQLVRSYVEAVKKHREYERGALFLLDLADTRPGEVAAIQEAAHLYLLAGQTKDAAATYERAAKLYVGRRDFSRLRNVVEKLEACDSRAAQKWRKFLVGSGAQTRGVQGIWLKLAVCAAILLTMTGGAFVVYEWGARVTYAEVLASADHRVKRGDFAGALEDLDQFRRAYTLSLVARTVETDLRRIEALRSRSETKPPDPPSPSPQPAVIEREVEHVVSRAAKLKQQGDYQGALEHYRSVDFESLGENAGAVRQQIAFLEEYVAGAQRLLQQARTAERGGNLNESARIQKRILESYPCSPAATHVRFPLRIDVLPPDAIVTVNGTRIPGPPHLVSVAPGDLPRITAEAPSFTPHHLTVDPQEHWQVRIHLQKESRWITTLEASIEAEPLILPDRIIVGARSGRVYALSADTGSQLWSFDLDGLGDPLGAVRRRGEDVLFTGTDQALYRVSSEDGKLVYRMPFPNRSGFTRVPLTPPDPNGRSYLVTTKGLLLGVDVDEGRVLWSVSLGGSGNLPPQRIENVALAANPEGRLFAVDGVEGRELWSVTFEKPVATVPCGDPVRVLVGCENGRVYALSTLTGEKLWQLEVRTPPRGEILLLEDEFLFVTEGGELTCAQLGNGTINWRKTVPGTYQRGPQRIGAHVVTLNEDGVVHAFLLANGEDVWSYASGGTPGCPITVGAAYFVICNLNHRIHAVAKGSVPR